MGYEKLSAMLTFIAWTSCAIGENNDRPGIQQALDLGATTWCSVPYINREEEARQAVSCTKISDCGNTLGLFPQRSMNKAGCCATVKRRKQSDCRAAGGDSISAFRT